MGGFQVKDLKIKPALSGNIDSGKYNHSSGKTDKSNVKDNSMVFLYNTCNSVKMKDSTSECTTILMPIIENEVVQKIKNKDPLQTEYAAHIEQIQYQIRDFKNINKEDIKYIEKNTTLSEKVRIIKLYNDINETLIDYIQHQPNTNTPNCV